MTASAEVALAEFRAERALWRAGELWRQPRARALYERYFRQACAEGSPPDALSRHSKIESVRFFSMVREGADGHAYALRERFRANDGRQTLAARWWWEHLHGRPSGRAVLRPTCGERACINPAHQELISWSAEQTKFSEEALLGAIQVVAARLGRSPTREDYELVHKRPSARTIIARLGSWGRALHAAGLPPSSHVSFRPADECLEALRTDIAERGRPPTRREWRDGHRSPSDTTIMRRFGTWKEAVRVASLADILEP